MQPKLFQKHYVDTVVTPQRYGSWIVAGINVFSKDPNTPHPVNSYKLTFDDSGLYEARLVHQTKPLKLTTRREYGSGRTKLNLNIGLQDFTHDEEDIPVVLVNDPRIIKSASRIPTQMVLDHTILYGNKRVNLRDLLIENETPAFSRVTAMRANKDGIYLQVSCFELKLDEVLKEADDCFYRTPDEKRVIILNPDLILDEQLPLNNKWSDYFEKTKPKYVSQRMNNGIFICEDSNEPTPIKDFRDILKAHLKNRVGLSPLDIFRRKTK